MIVSLDFITKIFKNLKDVDINEGSEDNYVIELTGYRFKTFLLIIYAFYTNQLYLNLNDLPEIIEISLDLGIEKIIQFLKKLMINDDPIYVLFQLRIYLKEQSYSNKSLRYSSNRKIIDMLSKVITNYTKLINHPGILDLEFTEINYLVSKKLAGFFYIFKIKKCSEYDVIRSILDWYLIDKLKREEQCAFLLNKINFNNLTIEQLDKLVNCFPLNYCSNFVKNFIKTQFHEHIAIKRGTNRYFYHDLSKYEMISFSIMPEKALKRSKDDSKNINAIQQAHHKRLQKKDNNLNKEQILIKDDCLKNLTLLGPCSLTASKSLPIYYSINERSTMILLGGYQTHLPYSKDQGRQMHHLIRTTNDHTDQMISLPSILTHDWFPLKDRLPKNLSHFASIRIENCIFVLGGLDLNYLLPDSNNKLVRPISNCYLFNLTTYDWYQLKSMNYSRAYHCAVKYDNLIYVFGGLTCSANFLNVTNTMEYYDIVNNNWTLVYDLNQLSVLPSPR